MKNETIFEKATKKPNYRLIALTGFIFFVGGMTSSNPGLLVIGLACLAVGIGNKDKWGKGKI